MSAVFSYEDFNAKWLLDVREKRTANRHPPANAKRHTIKITFLIVSMPVGVCTESKASAAGHGSMGADIPIVGVFSCGQINR